MTIEIGERVDEAVKEGPRLVQQCHLWLTRASWERGKGHQDTHSGILSNSILIRLHQHEQVQNSIHEKGLASGAVVAAQKQQCHLWLTRGASWEREERAIRTLTLASDPIRS